MKLPLILLISVVLVHNVVPLPMDNAMANGLVIEEGQACGCDMTMSCLGECKPGLECTFDDVSAGHGICTKTKK